ncbi:MAG: hypothetical protein OXU23_12810 [Candidatus Poribacteria bacterium]|nr:hypothetical protein [Candidatus Poribacteria bacterium]MDE0481865.1 hypothetical protein [Candidatus Poribacteria bacterium]
MLEQNNTSLQDNNKSTLAMTPLKPMGFGEILDTTFSLYRKNLTLFLGPVAFSVFGELALHLFTDFSDFFFSRYLLLGIGMVIFAVTFFTIGVGGIVIGTGATYLNEDITIRSVLQHTIQRFWQLLGCLFLWSLVVGGLTVTIIGIPFAIFFAVRWGFFIGTVMLEKPVVSTPFRRSGQLVSEMWWQMFGMLLAIFLFSTLVHAIFEISIGFILILTNPGGEIDFIDILEWGLLSEPFENSAPFFHAILLVIHLCVYAISFPIWIIGVTLVYFNQRIRKEGFDIEMQARDN